MRLPRLLPLMMLSVLNAVSPAHLLAQAAESPEREAPLQYETDYAMDLWHTRSGGRSDNTVLGLWRASVELNGEHYFRLPGARFHLSTWASTGGSVSEVAGDCQGVSNIEAPRGVRLFEAWYDQQFPEQGLSLRMGQYDLNSEFDVIDAAGLFLNSSHGIGPDLAQVGDFGPSIFPYTALGFRLRLSLSEHWSLNTALIDPNPREADTDLPVLLIAEARGTNERDSVWSAVTLGGWMVVKQQGSRDRGAVESPESGLYGSIQFPIEELLSLSDADAFIRLGSVLGNRPDFGFYGGAGVNLRTGWLETNDRLGLALAVLRSGEGHPGPPAASDIHGPKSFELALELTYQVEALPWLTLRPDLQWVLNPGHSAGPDALLMGGRLMLTLP